MMSGRHRKPPKLSYQAVMVTAVMLPFAVAAFFLVTFAAKALI
jgi:hypothetical protein